MSLLCVDLNQTDPSVCAMHSQTLENFQLFRGDIVRLKSAGKDSILVCLNDDTVGFGNVGIPQVRSFDYRSSQDAPSILTCETLIMRTRTCAF